MRMLCIIFTVSLSTFAIAQRTGSIVPSIPNFDRLDLSQLKPAIDRPDLSQLKPAIFPGVDKPNFNFPKLCFKGAATAPRPGLCVERSRCKSGDQSGSGACGAGQICCQHKDIGTSSSGGTHQQLVEICGRPTPNDFIFPSRVAGGLSLAELPTKLRGTQILATRQRRRRSPRNLSQQQMVQVAPTRPTDVNPVVGGTDVPVTLALPVGRWPWMALLGFRDSGSAIKWQCGGAVLNGDTVLTAAHCVASLRSKPHQLTVRLGEYDISRTSDGPGRHTDVNVSRILVHPAYRAGQNDIAILRLSQSVTFSARIRPVCLPAPDSEYVGQRADLAGWGRLEFGGRVSDVLQEVTVLIVDEKRCEETYRRLGAAFTVKFPGGFQGTKICANGEDGTSRDACQGDSGGPLVVQNTRGRYQVVGVVSGGQGCGNPDFPGIYTKVSKYIPWIVENSS